MKILLFGNIGSGKTTFSLSILQKYSQWPYLAIDDFRRQFGDQTIVGERIAQQHFLQACA